MNIKIPVELYSALCETIPSTGDVEHWRAYRDLQHAALGQLDALLREHDEAELARMQEQMAALQARLGQKPETPSRAADQLTLDEIVAQSEALRGLRRRPEIDADGIVAPPSYAETDAGAGRGGGREPPMTTEEFNSQLAELRDRTTSKRARGGLG